MHPDVIGETHPERLAIVMDTGETRTYAQLASALWRIAGLFDSAGLRAGDHVAICMDNGPEMLEVLWGAHSAGLLYTACSTQLTPGELAHVVDDCGAAVVVASAAQAARAEAIIEQTPGVRRRLSVGGHIDGHDPLEVAVSGVPGTPKTDAVAGADMLYSSGTTGLPKGIEPGGDPLPLRGPNQLTAVMQHLLGFRGGDVYLSPAPLYHAAPLRACMAVHRLGGTVVLMRHFDAQRALTLIEAHRVTHAQFVPTMFSRLLRLPAEVRAAHDHSSLTTVWHGAAPCPPDVKRAMLAWWGPIIHEYYGATEGSGATWITSAEWLEHPGSVGRAVLGVPHIVGADGRELPTGETGRVYFSDGPAFRYHADPEKTAGAHNGQGWSTYGDIGHLDPDGYLYLTDREAFMIISGGVNVYPQEAEDVLLGHPQVLDAAVFGVPDDDLGERVHAVVEPVALPADPSDLAAELIAHCRARLAGYKCPRGIDFRPALPRHETGKLYKRLLVDEYSAAATMSDSSSGSTSKA